jgi:tetratricopeptide (TPR) repeat protein
MSLAFSPNGRTFLARCFEADLVQLWDAESAQPIGSPLRHPSVINAACFGPDGNTVLTAGEDGSARLWDTAAALPIGEPIPHQRALSSAQFSPDGKARGTAEGRAAALNVLSAILYRAGRFEEAVRLLEEGIAYRNGTGEPIDWPFLAMAHQQLGHRDEARRWLNRLRTRKLSSEPDQILDELEIRILKSEAETVGLYDPVFPANPFAR